MLSGLMPNQGANITRLTNEISGVSGRARVGVGRDGVRRRRGCPKGPCQVGKINNETGQ